MTAAVFGSPALPPNFWQKVQVSGTGCWDWTGSLNHAGYGRFTRVVARQRKSDRVHRLAFAVLVRPLTPGLTIDHLCRNLKTHCPQGHEYSLENTYVCPKGRRNCRRCARERPRDRRGTWTRVCDVCGTSYEVTYRPHRRTGACSPPCYRELIGSQSRGSRSGRAKLSEAQVVEIRARLRGGATVRGLAREFGVSQPTVQRIRDRKVWTHVP